MIFLILCENMAEEVGVGYVIKIGLFKPLLEFLPLFLPYLSSIQSYVLASISGYGSDNSKKPFTLFNVVSAWCQQRFTKNPVEVSLYAYARSHLAALRDLGKVFSARSQDIILLLQLLSAHSTVEPSMRNDWSELAP